MDLLYSVVLGVIEGVTEFLPVSSTAHLIITSKLLGLPDTEYQKFFEVFIQSGAILAVVLLYLKYVLKNKKLLVPLVLSFIPTAAVGFLLHGVIKNIFFESMGIIATSLAVVGILFIGIERLIISHHIKLRKSINAMTPQDALIIGLLQSVAVIPGVSRAGAVILAMLLLRYKREDAALYSFLLAVPTILAASLYDLYKSKDVIAASGDNAVNLAVGFTISFIVALVAVRWLIGYLRHNSLVLFGYYRLLLAIIVVLLFLF